MKQYGKVWELIGMPKKGKKFMYKYPISIGHAFVASSLDSVFPLQFIYNSGAPRWALKFCDGLAHGTAESRKSPI